MASQVLARMSLGRENDHSVLLPFHRMDNRLPSRWDGDEDFWEDDESHDRLRLRDRVVQIINSAILE